MLDPRATTVKRIAVCLGCYGLDVADIFAALVMD